MKKILIFSSLLVMGFLTSSFGPPNCMQFTGDCALACLKCQQAIQHRQGSRASQIHFDEALALCPTFAYAPYEKSVPYGKRGLTREWKKWMDKAVELRPTEYLGLRGWDHFIWMRNYEATIADLEKLAEMLGYDIGMTGDGTYHLEILRGLAYKGLKNYPKALEVIQAQMNKEGYHVGLYDHLHVGVLYLELGEPKLALEALKRQQEENEISEVYFYSAKAHQLQGNAQARKENLQLALDFYERGKTMNNPYRQLPDRIYKLDITEELEKMEYLLK